MEKGTTTPFLLGTTLIALLGGCKSSNPVALSLPSAGVTLAITVQDAGNSALLPATVTLLSASGTTVKGQVNPGTGVYTYTLPTATSLTKTSTLYTLAATATGYGASTMVVTVPPPTVAQLKAGVELVPATLSLAKIAGGGAIAGVTTVSNQIVFATPVATSTVAGTPAARVTIPTGTTFTGANGAPVEANSIVVSYYNNQTPAAMAAAPSGSTTILNGVPTALVSGGGVSATILDANHNPIDGIHFSQPVSLEIDIPAGTVNPNTHLPVALNDPIPVFFVNGQGALALLTPAGSEPKLGAEVGKGTANAYFPLTFQTIHFCFFNAAWPLAGASIQNALLTINGAGGKPLSGTISLASGGWSYTFGLTGGETDPITVTLPDVPTTGVCDLTFMMGGVQLTTSPTQPTITGGGSASVTLTNVPSLVSVGVIAQCTNASAGPSPLAGAIITATCTSKTLPAILGVTDATGTVTLQGLVSGQTYEFSGVTADGKQMGTINKPVTTGTSATFNALACNATTGLSGIGGI